MQFDFIRFRPVAYAVAAALVAIAVVAPFVADFRLGIDMTGGMLAEYTYDQPVSVQEARTVVADTLKALPADLAKSVNTSTTYAITGEKKFAVEVGFSHREGVTDEALKKTESDVRAALDKALQAKFSAQGVVESRYVNIGEAFGQYIRNSAYVTLALVIVAISAYIVYAFWGSIEGASSLSFALVTSLTLFHDVIVTFGLYVIASSLFPEFTIDTFFITAMLTVLGYSINDTIVILDRIRASLKLPENKRKAFRDIVNDSINSTMTRSIYTSLTVMIVLVAMFFFGPATLKGFTLALIFGTIIGTYSSVCISAPLLYDLNKKR